VTYRVFKAVHRTNYRGGGDTGPVEPGATILFPADEPWMGNYIPAQQAATEFLGTEYMAYLAPATQPVELT
jgi:hypothetical protein